ncbi:MAG TPA: universal stress protein [Planctomycetota bacterium]|nr:universal stress protein [Planctomycetota bacterium]
MIGPVLVALDGSKNAEKVLPLVEPLLRKSKGKALLLQVLPPGEVVPDAAAQAYLKEIAARLAKSRIRAEGMVVHGDPAVVIVEIADKVEADLVAFTSHGQGGLSQWVFGSVAQKVLRGCDRPLLIVRALEPASATLKRIVVPLDGGRGSEAILPHALAIARACGATVDLIHVTTEHGVEADDSKLRGWIGKERKRMDARFAEIEKGAKGLKFTRLCEDGDAATRILARAEKEPESMIAMANHARTGFSRWIYGSVTEKVLQAAKCPVLIARTST